MAETKLPVSSMSPCGISDNHAENTVEFNDVQVLTKSGELIAAERLVNGVELSNAIIIRNASKSAILLEDPMDSTELKLKQDVEAEEEQDPGDGTELKLKQEVKAGGEQCPVDGTTVTKEISEIELNSKQEAKADEEQDSVDQWQSVTFLQEVAVIKPHDLKGKRRSRYNHVNGRFAAAVDDPDTALAKEMLAIERKLEQEVKAQEEQRLREEAERLVQETREKCYKRLQLLLNRSNIYTKFLVSRMEKQQQDAAQKRELELGRKKKKKSKEESQVNNEKPSTRKNQSDTAHSSSSSQEQRKRNLKTPEKSRSHKRPRQDVQLSDIFTIEDLESSATRSEDCSSVKAPVEDTYSRTINGERISDLQPNLFTGGAMRQYQIEALEWLKVLYENGVNGILADEMGLGKTIEVIALIAHLVEMGVAGPYLIICPLSTVCNWVKEFNRFTPEIPVVMYHGIPSEREMLRKQLRRKVLVREKPIYPVFITSYAVIMNDKPHLKNMPWIIIIDEGHRIKNWQCRLVRDLKQYQSTNRLLLTGTPLQNNLAELWSLLNFLLPEVFNDLQVFESWFDIRSMIEQSGDEQIIAQEQEKQIVSTIHQILTPFLLRRTKADVDLKLPPKKELIVYAPFTPKQMEMYRAVANDTLKNLLGLEKKEVVNEKRYHAKVDYTKYYKNYEDLEGMDALFKTIADTPPEVIDLEEKPEDHSVIKLTSNHGFIMMRKICNHPYLVEFPLDPRTQDYLIDEKMIKVSGKLQVLDLMLPELKKRGHKVLLFSQFVIMLDILDYYCEMRGYSYHRIHGAIKVKERQRLIDDFNQDPSVFLFLISTRAGGLGINLTKADTVIIYDSDWNPQNDLQAQDRCHRYGQTKPVVVYRLVTANTVDQQIVERACAKRKLEKMIIHNGRFSSCEQMKISKLITPKELLELLRQTDFNGGSVSVDDVISPEDLNLLLDRSDMLLPTDKGRSFKNEDASRSEVSGVFKLVEQVRFDWMKEEIDS